MNGDHKAGKFDAWCQTRIRRIPHDRVPMARRLHMGGPQHQRTIADSGSSSWEASDNNNTRQDSLVGQEGFPGAPSQPTTIPKLSRTKVHPADPPLNPLGENTPARHALYGIHIRHWIHHDHSRGIQIYTSKLEFETKPTNQLRLLCIPPHFRCHGLWKTSGSCSHCQTA